MINFHTLNEKTIGDVYPLSNIMEMSDQLGSAEYFSIFDLASEFYQISMYIDCLMHKKQRFPLCTALSWIRYYQDYKGTICSFILMTLLLMRFLWPNTRQNSINSPNDYNKRILSCNQTNMSFCKKK